MCICVSIGSEEVVWAIPVSLGVCGGTAVISAHVGRREVGTGTVVDTKNGGGGLGAPKGIGG